MVTSVRRQLRWVTAATIIKEWVTENERARNTMLDFIWNNDPKLYNELYDSCKGIGLAMLIHLIDKRTTRWNWLWHLYNNPPPMRVMIPRPSRVWKSAAANNRNQIEA